MTEEDDAMAEYIARHTADFEELVRAARGADVVEAERLVRAFARTYAPHTRDSDLVVMARVMSNSRWALKHPISAFMLAWRQRDVRPVRRTLRQLWRPRFAG